MTLKVLLQSSTISPGSHACPKGWGLGRGSGLRNFEHPLPKESEISLSVF